jgi:hypothetical protein
VNTLISTQRLKCKLSQFGYLRAVRTHSGTEAHRGHSFCYLVQTLSAQFFIFQTRRKLLGQDKNCLDKIKSWLDKMTKRRGATMSPLVVRILENDITDIICFRAGAAWFLWYNEFFYITLWEVLLVLVYRSTKNWLLNISTLAWKNISTQVAPHGGLQSKRSSAVDGRIFINTLCKLFKRTADVNIVRACVNNWYRVNKRKIHLDFSDREIRICDKCVTSLNNDIYNSSCKLPKYGLRVGQTYGLLSIQCGIYNCGHIGL